MKKELLVGRDRGAGIAFGRAWLTLLACVGLVLSCAPAADRLEPRSLTWAELRTVRSGVRVSLRGESKRAPYPRERLSDGAGVEVDKGGVVWVRPDGGATLLVRGPAAFTLKARGFQLTEGQLFADTPPGAVTQLDTPQGPLTLSGVRASVEVSKAGAVRAYVLSGEVRAQALRVHAGEELSVASGQRPEVKALKAWEDWTGGLATTDRAAAPTPFGVGSVGARRPAEQGSPRFPLSIQRLDVRVSFEGDFAITEVDQSFFNPSSEVVEGLYSFRTPPGATLQRFGVDREGVVVWGRVKEKAAAAAQYQANVYQGSTEDPALLEWDAPGVYRARLYPIGPAATRRVVVRYAEWLERSGEHSERRLYVYPMAAEGSEESLPHVEELKVTFELAHAKARDVRAGMAGERRGDQLLVRAHDFVPRADLALELYDDGAGAAVAYTAPHSRDVSILPPEERAAAKERAQNEADYVLVPIRNTPAKAPEGGLDLAIVIDASAATDSAMLSVARAATTALLAELGERDRALVLAGDAALRPVVPALDKLSEMTSESREKIRDALADVARGGATDLGAMIADAALRLDPARRSALVYIGDAAPTVGELSLSSLRERLGRLAHPVRVFGLGVGDSSRLDLLSGLARGAFAERISDASQAAHAALRVLEEAERPAWLGSMVDLGPNVDRVFPREASAIVGDETLWVIGRRVASKGPERVRVTQAGTSREFPLEPRSIDDGGDLGRRWAEARLAQMLEDGEGRAALVDLGMKGGIITPVTSLYVPTANEMSYQERAELEDRRVALSLERTWPPKHPSKYEMADDKEGGTGTRAKGEEGSMGAPAGAPVGAGAKTPSGEKIAESAAPTHRAAKKSAAQPQPEAPEPAPPPALDNMDPHTARQAALREASEFGMIGALEANKPAEPAALASAAPAAPAPAAPPPAATSAPAAPWGKDDVSARGNMWGDEIGDAFGAGGLGLSGIGNGGGAMELGSIGAGQGFGAGHGRLGSSHATSAPKVRMGESLVSGRLPKEVVSRIVRQNFGRFRMCYEQGLGSNPNLEGSVKAQFVIGRDGGITNVSNAGSDLPDARVVSCVMSAFYGLSFPEPEGGIVTVVFPISFEPPSGPERPARKPSAPPVTVQVFVGDLPRNWLLCSRAAETPLEARIQLWRERLSKVSGRTTAVVDVYRNALANCEAPTFRERSRLLSLMLDAMPGVTAKVGLYRSMLGDLGAADVLYRGLLARVKTPEEMRELHTALGLRNVDPGILEKLVQGSLSPAERAARLRALSLEFPDDFALALALLDALEDAGDVSGLRDEARRLRQRAEADANVRTALGELYLRLGAREKDPAEQALWLSEARRAFGEIVEFAPQDPVARRRLGDLLLSHGFFADAKRQYETLAELTPDDSKVQLLLAAAAQGQGLLEESLKWIEKGGAAGSPDADSGAAVTARALGATYLAWARAEAREAKHDAELAALTARAARVLAGSRAINEPTATVRASLSWSHPELHPTLWSNALGTPMPAVEGDVTLGILQAHLPERDSSFVEVRLEQRDLAHAARLGAIATLTCVFDELGKTEKIVKIEVRFERGGPSVQRFSFAGREVHRG